MTPISETKSRREENEVFEQWKHTGRPEVLEELGRLLLQHATAVTYLIFRQRREDVAQEAVIKGLEGMEGFRGDSLFSTWFHAVAMNHAKTRLRQEILATKTEPLEDEGAVEQEDWPLQLEELMKYLDAEDQELIRDKLEGRVESELTQKYNLTPEGIRSRWDAIKKKLRKKIE